jgi:hypothetical protein
MGRVYVSGLTSGEILGGTSSGSRDAFLAAFSDQGVFIWNQQFGSEAVEASVAVSSSGLPNELFVVGETTAGYFGFRDVFVARFNTVPEPSALFAAALAHLGFVFLRRR